MKAVSQTRLFGLKVGINPKVIPPLLLATAGLLYWYNSANETETANTATRSSGILEVSPQPKATRKSRALAIASRRQRTNTDRGVLKLLPVDATQGDLDPAIRLDLLAKVHSVNDPLEGRNLFEIGEESVPAVPIKGPVLMPEPIPVSLPTPNRSMVLPMQLNIPLKYYGYVSSPEVEQSNRGLFLDGDQVLVAARGEFVKGRYLVVELTPLIARMEDTQVKLNQVLAVATP